MTDEAFYWDLNDSTRAWSARFAQRMEGRVPTINHAATYSATIAYLRAVQTAQTIEGDKVIAQLQTAEIDDPLFGPIKVRKDGRAIHTMFVFEVKPPQESRQRYDYYKLVRTIPAEEAFRPIDQGECPLVK